MVSIAILFLSMDLQADGCVMAPDVVTAPTLRVATLNIAHGRKDANNQLLVTRERFQENLRELARLFDRAERDVIALQEADAPSRWSGNFDHVEFLVRHSRYGCARHGVHASTALYDFGTALLSPHRLQNALVHSFEPSWPTTTKGFTVAELKWNPDGRLEIPLTVRFATVHLDFSRRSVRQSQVDELVAVLGGSDGPMVVMGDFNTDWLTPDSSLRRLVESLDLRIYEPHAEGLATYGDKGARLDWILISSGFDFLDYRVFPDIVSDHYAVAADIGLPVTE